MKKYKNYLIGIVAGVLWGMYIRGEFNDRKPRKQPKM